MCGNVWGCVWVWVWVCLQVFKGVGVRAGVAVGVGRGKDGNDDGGEGGCGCVSKCWRGRPPLQIHVTCLRVRVHVWASLLRRTFVCVCVCENKHPALFV